MFSVKDRTPVALKSMVVYEFVQLVRVVIPIILQGVTKVLSDSPGLVE